jgi:hypothetical protein
VTRAAPTRSSTKDSYRARSMGQLT